MGFVYSVLGFLIAIAVLVAVHEFGHFWVARKLGVKVLRFSIGFGKPLWRKVAGEDQTEYVIAAIPLGGYVKMLGEGTDQDPVDPSELHRAFDRQPVWKRTLIVAAGPGINFLFAMILFMFLGMSTQRDLIPVFGPIAQNSKVAQAGIQEGDRLLSVNGRPTRFLMEHELSIFNQVLKGNDITLEVESAVGQARSVVIQTTDVPIYNINAASLMRELGFVRLAPPDSTEIGVVVDGTPASQAGLQKNDRFVSIGDKKINSWRDLSAAVMPSAGTPLDVVINRDGVEFSVEITPAEVSVNGQKVGRLGVANKFIPYPENQIVALSRSPFEAVLFGVERTWLMSSLTVRMLWKMLTGQVSPKNVNGPITIADVAGQAIQINWQAYLSVLAVISISLGVMNLLPIPMLDGGHLMMYLIEVTAGKGLSEKFFIAGQKVGILLLACLMSLAFYNDIFKLLN